ncbi:hypothetical protein jhhlp_002628 [Lomentospora prolificans]|uniref:Protein-lysine N-methyltransferase EFM5 n=1 Tax=Lomentospora prolificans TaxID=41688 RepID=A0A2N3NEN5_9PEZI|nr:hypothetical protein jhhlp_002628 [Lomentospora prolificans]
MASSHLDSDDEPLTLSDHALAALAEFNAERDAQVQEFERVKAIAQAERARDTSFSIESFTENWGRSQFWYTDETATLLAGELLNGTSAHTIVAFISTPSVFVAAKNLVAEKPASERPTLYLLEFDERFRVFPEFVYYDYRRPFKLPPTLKGKVDRVISDPPFLNEDCQAKVALSVSSLIKSTDDVKLLMCTGERVQELVLRLYKKFGMKTTTFAPTHNRELGNEFLCYANFESTNWTWMNDQQGST